MDVKAFLELFDRLAKVSTVYGKEDVLNAAALSRAILELSQERFATMIAASPDATILQAY